ncbi:AAA family ATPase, partial [Patescibacteria group bacterium]|nr:AAA family ATPase [Patescibacteria group bacterium]
MILTKITIKNVKSFRKATTINFSKGLNVLIGPNSGGKSNLLEIIQGTFNDLFFEDINIQDNEDTNTRNTKPYKIEKQQVNTQHLSQNILDKYEGESGEQKLSFFLLIEKNDINNIKFLEQSKEDLKSFERDNTTSSVLYDFVKSFNFGKDYTTLVDKT